MQTNNKTENDYETASGNGELDEKGKIWTLSNYGNENEKCNENEKYAWELLEHAWELLEYAWEREFEQKASREH